MRITTQTKVGQVMYNFTIEENNEMEALHKAIVLSNPKRKCNACENIDQSFFKLESNKDKEGNIYVNVICTHCGAQSKLGRYKAGGYFWHKFEKYEKGNAPQADNDDVTFASDPSLM